MADLEVQSVFETKRGGHRVRWHVKTGPLLFEKRGTIEHVRGGAKVAGQPFPSINQCIQLFFFLKLNLNLTLIINDDQ